MTWRTLPAWVYEDPEFLALERDTVFLTTWQLAGHVSDMPRPGDWLGFSLLGRTAFAIRGRDGEIRAFHNVCRHRAMRMLDGRAGHCDRAIRCPYHGFSYDLDGRLAGVPFEEDFPDIDRATMGLHPIETEIFLGFVFIRFGGAGPSVAGQLAPCRQELDSYRIAEMQPIGPFVETPINADWKVAVDNNLEAYHVPAAHPGLQRLYGASYRFEVQSLGVSQSHGRLRDKPSPNWSERAYLNLLPEVAHLSAERQREWHYYSMFPSLAFDVYPDLIDFFQIVPTGPGKCLSRLRSYALPDARRAMRAARYLNMRINAQVGREDVGLVEGVQVGLASGASESGPLSRREGRVRQFHDMIRDAIPVATLGQRPPPGRLAAVNAEMLRGR